MLAKRIIPCLDIKDGQTVKGVQFENLRHAGDPVELSLDYVRMRQILPQLRVVGGCCGTDLRHVAAIGQRFAHAH